MNNEWQKQKIENLPIQIIDSDRSSNYPKRDEFVNKGIVFLNTSNFVNNSLDFTTVNYITFNKYSQIKKGRAMFNDIIMTTRGTVGKIALFKKDYGKGLINAQMLLLRADNQIIDSKYLFYLLSTDIVQAQIKNFSSGSAQPQIPIQDLKKIEIVYPIINIQQKIASILSAYDDLIENNMKRVKILEEMAQMIYKEWFINFRFPGFEKVKMVDSPLGKIPEGWEVKKLGEICEYINRGISPKYDDLSDNLVVNQRCIRDERITMLNARKHNSHFSAEKEIKFGDVLINSTGVGTLGRVAQVYFSEKNITADSHVSIVRPSEAIAIDYFGVSLINKQSHFESHGVGSTGQTELSREVISSTTLLLPPYDLQRKFGSLVSPMRYLIEKLFVKNDNLRQTRDLLLPKLMNGEIEVSM